MDRLLLIIIILNISPLFIKAQVRDIFSYTPVHKFANTEVDTNEIQFISYSSNSRLKDLLEEEDPDHPLFLLEQFITAASTEEINAITLEESEKWDLDQEELKRKSHLYQTDSVDILIQSQIILST